MKLRKMVIYTKMVVWILKQKVQAEILNIIFPSTDPTKRSGLNYSLRNCNNIRLIPWSYPSDTRQYLLETRTVPKDTNVNEGYPGENYNNNVY